MYSGDNSAPPSFSSTGMRTVDPQLPAVDQYTTQAPSISSTAIRNSESQFPTDGQRTVADDTYVQAPSYSGFQHAGNSLNGFSSGNGEHRMSQTHQGDQAPGLEAVVRENNSTTGFNNDSGHENPPSQSAMVPQNHSNPGGGSTATPEYNPQYSIVGRNFPRGNLTAPYNYSGMK